MSYTVYPAQPVGTSDGKYSTLKTRELSGSTTHMYDWQQKSVSFKSMKGLTGPSSSSFWSKTYQPSDFKSYIPQTPMPLMINFWVHKSGKMADTSSKEIIIASVGVPAAPKTSSAGTGTSSSGGSSSAPSTSLGFSPSTASHSSSKTIYAIFEKHSGSEASNKGDFSKLDALASSMLRIPFTIFSGSLSLKFP